MLYVICFSPWKLESYNDKTGYRYYFTSNIDVGFYGLEVDKGYYRLRIGANHGVWIPIP